MIFSQLYFILISSHIFALSLLLLLLSLLLSHDPKMIPLNQNVRFTIA